MTSDSMTPQQALQAAVDRIGSGSALARLLKISQPSVWKWLKRKKMLPPEYVLLVESATGVSKHDLRPDIYPRPGAVADAEVAP